LLDDFLNELKADYFRYR